MGPGEHDDEVEEPPYRDPLPPDDRLWRHPSELEELTQADTEAQQNLLARVQRIADRPETPKRDAGGSAGPT